MSDQDEIVAALGDPAFYPHRPASVRHLETHISHVFVAGAFAYKLKKAVRFSFVDFSTVDLRRALCAQELHLNRRLCAPLYLDVPEVTREADGRLALAGRGAPVEPLVRMRALPAGGMLPVALAQGRVTAAALAAFSRNLVRFHASAETALAGENLGDPDAIGERWRQVLADAAPMVGTLLGPADHAVLLEYGETFLQRHATLLGGRGPAGRVRDGHGDLHAGNLCLVEDALAACDGAPAVTPGLYAFDCLEFSAELRSNDVASEVAFLAMDLTVRGHPDLAEAFVDAYVTASGDDELRLLLPFYGCHRATIRGMVLGLAAGADDASDAARADARDLGVRHFTHATQVAWRAAGPAIVLCSGLSGSGKTTLAVALARSTGFRLISSDALRKARAGLDPHQRTAGARATELYGEEARRAVYAALVGEARAALAAGDPVLLDATFHRRAARAPLHALARELRVPIVVVACVAEEDTVRERLRLRVERPAESSAGQPALSDAGFEVYLEQRAHAEPPGADEPSHRIDTSGARETVLENALRALWAWRRTHPARAPLRLGA